MWPSLGFLGGPIAMGLGDPTFGLYLSVLFFREMMVAKAKNGQIEGLSEYFSLLAVATGGFMFLTTVMQSITSFHVIGLLLDG